MGKNSLLKTIGIFLLITIGSCKTALINHSIFRSYLVRLDNSDCVNSNVNKKSGMICGSVSFYDVSGSQGIIKVHLKHVAPNTSYNIFLKCREKIGIFMSDSKGFATATFVVNKNIFPTVFAFDVYPDGAAPGNKYQSLPVNLL